MDICVAEQQNPINSNNLCAKKLIIYCTGSGLKFFLLTKDTSMSLITEPYSICLQNVLMRWRYVL